MGWVWGKIGEVPESCTIPLLQASNYPIITRSNCFFGTLLMAAPRILVIQLKRIGDLILTAPMLARLREQMPAARISLAVSDAAGFLAPCLPGVDDIIHFQRGRINAGYWAAIAGARPFEIAFDCDGTDRAAATAWVSGAAVRVTHAKHRKTFPRDRIFTLGCEASLKAHHTIDYLAALLDAAGIGGETPPLSLQLPREAREAADGLGLPDQYAVVHPGSARIEKFWSAERWAQVIDHLSQRVGLPVVVTGGPGRMETEHLSEIQRRSRSGFRNVAGHTSVATMAAVLARASLALTVDTAALHLASAFGVPQVALFGPTNPFRWGPRHGRAWVVRAGKPGPLPGTHRFPEPDDFAPMAEIAVDEVIEAAAKAWPSEGSA
ncbi:MAG: heptosyltransferase-2/heptosyltransferase-3 [Verrucomicrobia bacterium]|nr:MAG: heptosyltransferase-2/heptosyltransferase-3 [Verrucomicrobiota bacterium]